MPSRKYLVPAGIGLFLCACTPPQVEQATGILEVTPTVLDYHNVCVGSTSSFPVTLLNNGNGPLNVTSITSSSPSFALIAAAPKSIEPHQSVVVNVGFTPTAAEPYTGFLTIVTNANKSGTEKATMTGVGFAGPPVDFEVSCQCMTDSMGGQVCGNGGSVQQPCYHLDFGNVLTGSSAKATFTVLNNGCQPVTFQQALVYDNQDPAAIAAQAVDWFSVTPQPPAAIRGGASASYVVDFAPTDANSAINVRLSLTSNDPTLHASEGQTVAGTWDLGLFATPVAPQLLVTPNILTFYTAQMGVPDVQTFTIQNTGTSDLQLESVALTGETSEYSLQVPGGSSMTLAAGTTVTASVTFTVTASGGENALITVTAAGTPPQTVQLLGGAQPAMTVTWLDPSNNNAATAPPVDWGQTATGATNLLRTVRLQNTGSADLHLMAAVTRDLTNTTPSPSFSVPGFSPVTVTMGQSQDVTVVFNDDITIQNNSGKLDITSDDPADTSNGGVRSVDLVSTNTAIYAPIPNITLTPESPEACMTMTLDASSTEDAQNDPLTYAWTIASAPAGSHATLTAASAAKTNVTSSSCMGPDVPGTYTFNLTVTDATYPSVSSSLPQTVVVH